MLNPSPLYIFIDESGNFDFSPKGTKYYIFTAVTTNFPCEKSFEITNLKYDILNGNVIPGLGTDYLEDHLCVRFHATEDMQAVRNLFFNTISDMKGIQANSIVIQKNKLNPSLYDEKYFYSKFLGSLLEYVFQVYSYSSLCIFVDNVATGQVKRKQFIKTIKTEIKDRNPKTSFRIYFPPSSSNIMLQVCDYINWAIYKKWERQDERSYANIQHLLQRPERDIFTTGRTTYY